MNRYEKYKSSGIEWVGEIPSHWEVKRLKYEATLQGGFAFKSDEFVEDGTPIIRIGDIASKIDLENCKKTSEKNIPEEFQLKKHDTLIALSGATVGKMCVVENDMEAYINQRVARVTNGTKWMYHVLNSEFFIEQIELKAGGSAQENISTNDIANFFIPLPPIEEQTIIAKFLDNKTSQIDKLISNKEKLIELLKEEQTAVINEAVSDKGKNWERKKLKYVVTKVGSGVTPTGGASVYLKEGIPLLRSQNIYSDGFRLDDVAYINEKIDEQMSNTRIQEGDVLLNVTGASIGRCYYVPNNFGRGNVNQHVCIIRPIKSKITTKYLHSFLISGYGQTLIDACQNGANREGLNFQQIKSFEIPLPEISEQETILKKLQTKTQHIDNTISKTEKEIELMKEYRTALISEVVTGKIKIN